MSHEAIEAGNDLVRSINGEPKPGPTVGRIVHYDHGDGQCRAAIVTEVGKNGLGLHVFPLKDDTRTYGPASMGYMPMMWDVKESSGQEPGWHWPERA